MRPFILSVAVVVALATEGAGAAQAAAVATIPGTDDYYTFGTSVSANSGTRLLAGKATAIGFPFSNTTSFISFDAAALPSSIPAGGQALLKLEHDPDELGGTLRPADADNSVSLGVYALGVFGTPEFDPQSGNLFDIDFGPGGKNAAATTTVGEAGVYSWDVTSLVETWIADPTALTAVAISGIYGNAPTEFNAYGIFHAVGSANGLDPEIHVTPLPGALPLLLTAGAVLAGWRARRRRPAG